MSAETLARAPPAVETMFSPSHPPVPIESGDLHERWSRAPCISKQLVTAHGGSIQVRSRAPEGTELVVRLPRSEEVLSRRGVVLDA